MTDENGMFTGADLRDLVAETTMSEAEVAHRLKMTESHVQQVFGGIQWASPSFAERVLGLVTAFHNHTLPQQVPAPRASRPESYCGVGANLPDDFVPQPASAPTGFLAGSLEKIEVMCERARRGEEIFHPRDTHLSQHPSDMGKRKSNA